MAKNKRMQSDDSGFNGITKILRKLGRNAGPRPGNYFSIPQSSGNTFYLAPTFEIFLSKKFNIN